MNSEKVPDLIILILAVLALICYNLWYFTCTEFSIGNRRYVNLFHVNVKSRKEWVLILSQDAKEGINAVQTVRNLVLGVSILAAATAALASTLINLLTDTSKLEQIEQFSLIDPITDVALVSPPVKLGIALGILLLAIMAFAQAVRLAIHVGFTIRVVAADPAHHKALLAQSVTFMRRASLYFAIGLRLIYAFIPWLLYLLGPTALLIATVLTITALVLFDVVPASECEEEDSSAGAATQQPFTSQQQQHDGMGDHPNKSSAPARGMSSADP